MLRACAQVALLAVDAGPLQLHLAGGVAGLLGLVERLEGLVVLAARDQGPAEVEAGQGAFGLLQVLDGLAGVAEEERGDAELQVPASWRRRRWPLPASS